MSANVGKRYTQCGGISRKKYAGLDVAKAGWIATVIGMGGTALQPVFGSIADRFGPRRVILLGALLTSFALLLGPLADYQAVLEYGFGRWKGVLYVKEILKPSNR